MGRRRFQVPLIWDVYRAFTLQPGEKLGTKLGAVVYETGKWIRGFTGEGTPVEV